MLAIGFLILLLIIVIWFLYRHFTSEGAVGGAHGGGGYSYGGAYSGPGGGHGGGTHSSGGSHGTHSTHGTSYHENRPYSSAGASGYGGWGFGFWGDPYYDRYDIIRRLYNRRSHYNYYDDEPTVIVIRDSDVAPPGLPRCSDVGNAGPCYMGDGESA